MTQATAFTALAWISTLQWSVQSLPGIYNTVANLKPSLSRIDDFLTAPIADTVLSMSSDDLGSRELCDESASCPENIASGLATSAASTASAGMELRVLRSPRQRPADPQVGVPPAPPSWRKEPWLDGGKSWGCFPFGCRDERIDGISSAVSIQVKDAAFGYWQDLYPQPCETLVLEDVNVQVKRGNFVMIAGSVGSGKSTFLASLACARPALRGLCNTFGSRAYVPQKPFLLNGTVRENITFGLPDDEKKYSASIEMAALMDDLKMLTDGDSTLVGESGVGVSAVLRCLKHLNIRHELLTAV